MSSFYIADDITVLDTRFGELVVVVAGGEIDYGASPWLRARIDELIKAGRQRLVLDLSDVTFVDSTAIGVLVGAVNKLQELGGDLAVVCTHANVLRILEITGLDEMITLHASRDEAFSALAMIS
jgi:anti-sigma B factor antagonist